MRALFFAFGILFGVLLVAAHASDFDAITGMFLLTDFHLYGVIGVAVAVAAVGLALLRRAGSRPLLAETMSVSPKPMKPGLVLGALAFGAGWAIAGVCPGPALTQIGEGKLSGVAASLGILLGTWLASRGSTQSRRT